MDTSMRFAPPENLKESFGCLTLSTQTHKAPLLLCGFAVAKLAFIFT